MAKKQTLLTTRNIAIIIILLAIILPILWLWGTYNDLITKDQKVEAQWANVESQYQRRMDLIPNLVSSVQGYLRYERELLTQITELRSRWLSSSNQADKIQYGTALDSAIGRLLVVVENYPDLKGNTAVTQLMDELAGTENRIAVERQRYNDAVRDYNTAIRRFPANIVASSFGFEKKLYFAADQGAEEVPEVSVYP
ncbi:MAG TPA: LemA family protein [archaeon]|nr:LemA family protein [archaeon]